MYRIRQQAVKNIRLKSAAGVAQRYAKHCTEKFKGQISVRKKSDLVHGLSIQVINKDEKVNHAFYSSDTDISDCTSGCC